MCCPSNPPVIHHPSSRSGAGYSRAWSWFYFCFIEALIFVAFIIAIGSAATFLAF
ncbi:hypothetical protein BDB00DRAFT_821636 [Zychaea mexicana]|uniref:uncharacterized protein n=1 Tax=Zychaea mexicana TaxID=64656 RepID=UPI0022FE73C7|nr:uncharacterized protein BDB00DRAFT_821636 [Zychaea mexicana]KAI9493795.1 hypothetical protein BDB00DRAFT_821636 [Zychaea mexicana]